MIRYINKRFATVADYEAYIKKAVEARLNGLAMNMTSWNSEVVAKFKPLMNEGVLNDIIDTMVDETKYWGTEYSNASTLEVIS
jgi:hypothetical protein